jgi:hypothetical protein
METWANTAFAHEVEWPYEESSCKGVPTEGLAAYQVVGGVTAYQAYDA